MYIDYLCNHQEYVTTVCDWVFEEFVLEEYKSKEKYDELIKYYSGGNIERLPITLVAIESHECVGTVSIYRNDLKTQEELTPWLASLYVSPDCRGRGVAKKLISKVRSLMNELGYDKIYLRTENTADYYRRLGWEFLFKTTDEKNQVTEVFSIST